MVHLAPTGVVTSMFQGERCFESMFQAYSNRAIGNLPRFSHDDGAAGTFDVASPCLDLHGRPTWLLDDCKLLR
jgi:hypothetical protein